MENEILYSYSSLRNLFCPKRFKLYMKFKYGSINAKQLNYGAKKHEDFRVFLESKIPETRFQEEILNLVKQYKEVETEKYIQNLDFRIHGIVDVYLKDKDGEIDILELKTGAWDLEQLYVYKILTVARNIYLVNLTNKTIEQVDVNFMEAYTYVSEAVKKADEILEQENPPMKPGPHCATCPFAKSCDASKAIDIVTEENLPEAIGIYYQLKSRLKLLENMMKEVLESKGGVIETERFKVYFEETPYYKLPKGVSKAKMIERLIQDGKFELLDFKSKDVAKEYPHLFKELKRKNLKIIEKGADKDV